MPPIQAEMTPRVIAVSSNSIHAFSKGLLPQITVLAGLGVEGDAHCGVTVKHRSRVAQNPSQPNLRQVHLIHSELFDALAQQGFAVAPGEIGENITTQNLTLLALPVDTALQIGPSAIVKLTGLRNPCSQLDRFQAGLMSAVLGRTPDGKPVRKAGVMAVVVASGIVKPGDAITVTLPAEPHRPLDRVLERQSIDTVLVDYFALRASTAALTVQS
jgi:MOSC domain-containing protein YiiM